MAISSLVPVASAYIPGGMSVTVPLQYQVYQVQDPKSAGFYTITTNLSSYQVTLQFYTASGVQQSFTTSNGTVTAELTQEYLGYFIRTDSDHTDVICTLTQTAGSANSDRVTNYGSNITTVTSSGTYNTTGMLYVLAVGGGGGGGFYRNDRAAGGGGSGGVVGGFAFTNSPTTITIGSGGTGAVSENVRGNGGGTTSFGNFVSASGGGTTNGPGGGSQGPGGGAGGSGGWTGNYQPRPNSGQTGQVINKRVRTGSTGGGGGGYGGTNDGGASGGGTPYNANTIDGIGVGGKGGSSNTNGTAGTGYGSGGGGGGGSGNFVQGGAGAPGIVFVLNGIVI